MKTLEPATELEIAGMGLSDPLKSRPQSLQMALEGVSNSLCIMLRNMSQKRNVNIRGRRTRCRARVQQDIVNV